MPKAAVASVWNSAPCLWAMAAASSIGWIVPISPLAAITLTRMVLSSTSSASLSRRMMPSLVDWGVLDVEALAAEVLGDVDEADVLYG